MATCALALLMGCSSSQTTGAAVADAGADPADAGDTADAGPDHGKPSTSYPAPHAAVPKTMSLGGDVLAAPKLVTITFASDARAADLESFATALAASDTLRAATTEYGVGAATASTPIHLADAAPTSTTDGDIQKLVTASLSGATPAWGAPDKSAIYTLFYPPTTRITAPNGVSCAIGGFNGYHSEVALADGTPIVYAVIAGCDTFATSPFAGPKGTDEVTSVASHEWVEAMTDPHINSAPAFAQPDALDTGWLVVPGGEVGDMCGFNPNPSFVPSGFTHPVQRMWSNKEAALGHDPCVPHVSKLPYFNSAPVLTDKVKWTYFGTPVQSTGVLIPVGQTKTIELDLFSLGDTGAPWKIEVLEPLTWVRQKPELVMTLDRQSGQNGEKVYLTIKVLAKDKNFGAEFFAVVSTLGDQSNIWYGTVGNQ